MSLACRYALDMHRIFQNYIDHLCSARASENEITDQPYLLRMHAVDLKQLRFAVAAADYGSLRQAAELLSIRHSILSRSIRQLEYLIGVAIFERSGGGVKPTPAG